MTDHLHKAKIHYSPTAPADRHVYGDWRDVPHGPHSVVLDLGPLVSADASRVTCAHCTRLVAQGGRSPLSAVTLSLRGWDDDLPRDGVSRWAMLEGRYWRVWPRPGRQAGWHIEEVRADGEPAGFPRVNPNRSEGVEWVGGFYSTAPTLNDARRVIFAEVSRAAA